MGKQSRRVRERTGRVTGRVDIADLLLAEMPDLESLKLSKVAQDEDELETHKQQLARTHGQVLRVAPEEGVMIPLLDQNDGTPIVTNIVTGLNSDVAFKLHSPGELWANADAHLMSKQELTLQFFLHTRGNDPYGLLEGEEAPKDITENFIPCMGNREVLERMLKLMGVSVNNHPFPHYYNPKYARWLPAEFRRGDLVMLFYAAQDDERAGTHLEAVYFHVLASTPQGMLAVRGLPEQRIQRCPVGKDPGVISVVDAQTVIAQSKGGFWTDEEKKFGNTPCPYA